MICPRCGTKMEEEEVHYFGNRKEVIYRCPKCGKKLKVVYYNNGFFEWLWKHKKNFVSVRKWDV